MKGKQVGDSLPLGRFSEQGEVNQFRHVTSGMFAADAEAEIYDLFYGYAVREGHKRRLPDALHTLLYYAIIYNILSQF